MYNNGSLGSAVDIGLGRYRRVTGYGTQTYSRRLLRGLEDSLPGACAAGWVHAAVVSAWRAEGQGRRLDSRSDSSQFDSNQRSVPPSLQNYPAVWYYSQSAVVSIKSYTALLVQSVCCCLTYRVTRP